MGFFSEIALNSCYGNSSGGIASGRSGPVSLRDLDNINGVGI